MDREKDWVEQEMSHLKLADERLNKRAKKIVREMSQNPTGSIPGFSSDYNAARGAYNFFSNKQVKAEKIIAAQKAATLERIKIGGHRRILAIQDTTEFNFNGHNETEGLGLLSNAKSAGFLAHNTLAVSESGVPLGLLAQQVWIRDKKQVGKRAQRAHLPIAQKESYKWLQALDQSSQAMTPDVEVIAVSDRESDIFEYFAHPRPEQVALLVRANHDRVLLAEPQKLKATLEASPSQGTIEVEVRKTRKRLARTAICQVSFKQVTLKPPPKKPAMPDDLQPIEVWAVLVREIDPPEGEKPITWLLLTTLPVSHFETACQIIDFYTKRWLIERFHFVLKSGCIFEDRQLAHFDRLHRCLALSNWVAWRLLWLTYLGRDQPDLPCTVAFDDLEWQTLYSFVNKTQTLPDQTPTLSQATIWLAKLGGFLARKSDGYPGVKVLWRGWRRLVDIIQARLFFQPDFVT